MAGSGHRQERALTSTQDPTDARMPSRTPAVRTPSARPRIPRSAGLALGLALAVAVVGVLLVGHELAGRAPLPGRLQADAFTTYVSLLGDLAARLGAAATLGCFAGILFFSRWDDGHALSDEGTRLARIAAHTGQVWLWASVLQTFANSAYVNGVPLAYTLRPAAWWDFQTSTPSGLAWLLSALVAAACSVAGYAARRVAAFALSLIAGTLALVFVAVTGNVTVGLNHDWATDAAVWHTLALVPLVTFAVAVILQGDADGPADLARRVRRYHRVVPPLVLAAGAGLAVVAWQQLAGRRPDEDLYGWVVIAQADVLVALLFSWAVRALTREWQTRRALASVVRDGVLLVLALALATAENHVPSPRFTIVQSIQINYLGYEMDVPATLARLLGLGRPNWLWIVLSVGALAAYGWGVLKVRRRGGHWPPGRVIAWTAAWALMLYLAVTGFWEYSTVVYSWHMFVHMTVNMLVPALAVLGGPLTLLREASLDRSGDLAGPAEVVEAIGAYRPFARVFSPPVLWLNYVGSLFLIYYTPLFPWLMRYHWAHQLMLLYFLATGYLFFGLIVGVDKHVHDLPHLVRLALVISIMPFHALFAVGIMSSRSLIGADFYHAIDISWVGDLMADQNVAGQITWILGEIPLFIVMIALAGQWFAHDRAENAVSDFAQDTGADDSFDTYNDMLAQLAERDREATRKKYL